MKHCIFAKLITGERSGQIVCLPRITLSSLAEDLPFSMNRRQFPIRLGYVLTINKAQGQTFGDVGIYLPSPVFSHGQLYVALTRGNQKTKIKVKITHNNLISSKSKTKRHQLTYTKNVVYKEIL